MTWPPCSITRAGPSSVPDPVVVVGGSVAALVAADTLAAAGRTVQLHLPRRGVGSGFLPVVVGDRKLELGPRLVELAYDDVVGEAPPLDDYQPGPHGHRPYLSLVARVVRDLAGDELLAARPPELVRHGRRVADFLLGGDLASLPDVLTSAELDAVAREAQAALSSEGAAGVLAPEREPELWERTFADASVVNHGSTFHDVLIESIASKIVAGGSASVVAALRRRIWLPLFHPQTIVEACAGALTYRPNRPMQTLESGGMGTLVQRLLDRVRQSDRVTVVDADALASITRTATGVMLSFSDGVETNNTSPIIGVSPEEVFGAAGVVYEPQRVALSIAWIDVEESAVTDCPSVLFVADPDVPVFRISESTADRVPGVRTFSCELHHAVDADSLGQTAIDALRTLGVVVPGAAARVVRAGVVPAFASPTHEGVRRFEAARLSFDALELPVELVGGGAGFLADSFNEQIVQGLRAASRAH